MREPTIGSGAEGRVPTHLSFTRLLLLSTESESEAELNQDDFASRTGTVPTNFCEATTNAQATAYKSATTSTSNPRNHLPTPVRSRIRNSLLGDYPSSKVTSLITGLEYSFPSTHLLSLPLKSTLPQDKLRDTKEKVGFLPNKKQATLEQFQSLLGSLNFPCRALSPG